MTDEDHRTEAAILELTRRLRGAFEPHASTNGRLRQAVKRFEAPSHTLATPSAGARTRRRRAE